MRIIALPLILLLTACSVGNEPASPADVSTETTPLATAPPTTDPPVATTAVHIPIETEYDPTGVYLEFAELEVGNWSTVSWDDAGIPMVSSHYGGPYYFPTTIAHHGLSAFSRYQLHGDELDVAIQMADWFVANQDGSGGWPFPFTHDYYSGRTTPLEEGWYSAIAQGMAMSLLTRVYEATGEPAYLDTAKQALEPMITPVPDGVLTEYHGYDFYEEYPTNPPSLVLNGFQYALLGLYDLGQHDSAAMEAYDTGIETLRAMLPLWDLGDRTAYDLTHHFVENAHPNVARWSYHSIHTQLLSVFDVLEEGAFTPTVERWIGYARGEVIPGN